MTYDCTLTYPVSGPGVGVKSYKIVEEKGRLSLSMRGTDEEWKDEMSVEGQSEGSQVLFIYLLVLVSSCQGETTNETQKLSDGG